MQNISANNPLFDSCDMQNQFGERSVVEEIVLSCHSSQNTEDVFLADP